MRKDETTESQLHHGDIQCICTPNMAKDHKGCNITLQSIKRRTRFILQLIQITKAGPTYRVKKVTFDFKKTINRRLRTSVLNLKCCFLFHFATRLLTMRKRSSQRDSPFLLSVDGWLLNQASRHGPSLRILDHLPRGKWFAGGRVFKEIQHVLRTLHIYIYIYIMYIYIYMYTQDAWTHTGPPELYS